jgi:F420-non-reducing hydrogenase small subunit
MRLDKLKIGFYWAASCGGCEIAVLDLNEKILDVLSVADVVFWPVAMDVKYRDVEAMQDGYMDVCFFNGAVRSEEQEEMARLLRRKAKVLVAFGACAHLGGIPGLANLADRSQVFDRAFLHSPSTVNSKQIVPATKIEMGEHAMMLPRLYDDVMALDRVVDVDYYLPGCPPPVKLIEGAVQAVTANKLPPKGSVLGPTKSVCDDCSRKREEKKIAEIKRVISFEPDKDKCLLDQGVVCMGPATRSGCDARCLDANMPCTGCGGPCPEAMEQGASMISALSTVLGLASEKEEGFEAAKLVEQILDPVGTFYKYSLAASIINRRITK